MKSDTEMREVLSRQLHLKLKQWGIRAKVDAALAMQTEQATPVFDYLLAELRAFVVVEEQVPLRLEVPADWWEHFKQRWFPAWALARWPVRTLEIRLPVETIYPTLQTEIPPNLVGPTFTVLVKGNAMASFDTNTGRELSAHRRLLRKLERDQRDSCPTCGRDWRA